MRRKAVTLTPAPASLGFSDAVDRFAQATLILQQIAARIDAVDKTQSEEAEAQEGARQADTAGNAAPS